MGTKFVDRTGVRYGRLVAIRRHGTDANKKVTWECACDCGNVTVVTSGALATGNTLSCGCLLRDVITKHGGSSKGSYNTWRGMMRRCYNPADKDYPKYGGRGVVVHQQWHAYLNFAKDMGEPVGNETLDRIDPYGDYTPDNCRWASPTTQARNVRLPKSSKTGITGVLFHKNRYYAVLSVGKKKFYSKCYTTKEEAAVARKELEHVHWFKI
jgi:hypothetical protein